MIRLNENFKNALKTALKNFDEKFDLKRSTFVVLACVIALVLVLRAPQTIDAKEFMEFNRDLQNYNVKLQVLDEKNETLAEFSVIVADTDNKKMYGLMNLRKLPKDYGMLFPFFRSQVVMMWMKNTYIPLDMLFIDSNNVIVNIKHRATPRSLEIISSEKEVKKVLEINGGAASQYGIKVGHKIKIL